jgi:hypothetical protein
MTPIDKNVFLAFVADTLANNPEWFGDLVSAMQYGLSEAIVAERRNVSAVKS